MMQIWLTPIKDHYSPLQPNLAVSLLLRKMSEVKAINGKWAGFEEFAQLAILASPSQIQRGSITPYIRNKIEKQVDFIKSCLIILENPEWCLPILYPHPAKIILDGEFFRELSIFKWLSLFVVHPNNFDPTNIKEELGIQNLKFITEQTWTALDVERIVGTFCIPSEKEQFHFNESHAAVYDYLNRKKLKHRSIYDDWETD